MHDLSLGHIDLNPDDDNSIFNRYGDPFGLPLLCDALAKHHNVLPSEIAITTGASLGLAAILSHFEPGSLIACPVPYYPPYVNLISRFGLRAHFYNCNSEVDLSVSINELKNVDYQAILWNFPHNPTGLIPSEEIVRSVVEQCVNKNSVLISDEVYSEIFYMKDRPFYPSEMRGENIIIIKSFSKTMQLAGERVGYLIASSKLLSGIMKKHWMLAMSPPMSGQLRAYHALNDMNTDYLINLRERLLENRDLAVSILNEYDISPSTVSQGGVFLWLNNCSHSSEIHNFSLQKILSEHLIIASPGTSFGVDQNFVRVSFAIPQIRLVEAFTKLAKILSNFR